MVPLERKPRLPLLSLVALLDAQLAQVKQRGLANGPLLGLQLEHFCSLPAGRQGVHDGLSEGGRIGGDQRRRPDALEAPLGQVLGAVVGDASFGHQGRQVSGSARHCHGCSFQRNSLSPSLRP